MNCFVLRITIFYAWDVSRCDTCLCHFGFCSYILESYAEEASAVLKSSTTVSKVSNAYRRQSAIKENNTARLHKGWFGGLPASKAIWHLSLNFNTSIKSFPLPVFRQCIMG